MQSSYDSSVLVDLNSALCLRCIYPVTVLSLHFLLLAQAFGIGIGNHDFETTDLTT